jgi:hypothetical protein
MPENNRLSSISWKIPEFEVRERNRNWYLFAALFFLVCIFFSFFEIINWKVVFLGSNSNFIFPLILIATIILYIMNEGHNPNILDFTLSPTGVTIGSSFYDYDIISTFCVLYKPDEDLKRLYFEFKNGFRHPRLSINLYDEDPIEIRNFLKRYLDEDLTRIAPPISEQLTKLLKL